MFLSILMPQSNTYTVVMFLSQFVSFSPVCEFISSCVKGLIFLLMCPPSEIHRIRRCVGSWEEGPAGAGGVSGAAGETAGAQDKELFWPKWVDTHPYHNLNILKHIGLLSMNVPGGAESSSKLITTHHLDFKSTPEDEQLTWIKNRWAPQS